MTSDDELNPRQESYPDYRNIEAYKEAMACIRHYSNLRFASVTIFLTVTGALIAALITGKFHDAIKLPTILECLGVNGLISILGISSALFSLALEKSIDSNLERFWKLADRTGIVPKKFPAWAELIPNLFVGSHIAIIILWSIILFMPETLAQKKEIKETASYLPNIVIIGTDQNSFNLKFDCPRSYMIGPYISGEYDKLDNQKNLIDAVMSISQSIKNNYNNHHLVVALIIGSFDRQRLSNTLERKFGSNVGLAQARAIYVQNILEQKLHNLNITFLPIINGPINLEETGLVNQTEESYNMKSDRHVRLCLFSSK